MWRGLAGTERERERERQTRGPWPVGCLEFYCHHARKSEVGTGHLGAWIKQRGSEHRTHWQTWQRVSQSRRRNRPSSSCVVGMLVRGGGATDDLHGAYRSANKDPSSLLPPLLHQTPKTPRLPSCFLETPNHSPQQVPRQSHNSKLRYGGGRCS